MIKENNKNIAVNKKLSFPRVVVGNLPLTRPFMKKGKQPYFMKLAEDPRQQHSRMTLNLMGAHITRRGFTLIELLVVVLIIGILAAVAVPQYQKSVDRARYTQAMVLGDKIAKAQQQYFLANGSYAGRFDELDIDMPTPTSTRQDNQIVEFYFYNWGYCWTHSNYDACLVRLGTTAQAWYLTFRGAQSSSCWADPKDNARANAVCQSVTKKSNGTENGPRMIYSF